MAIFHQDSKWLREMSWRQSRKTVCEFDSHFAFAGHSLRLAAGPTTLPIAK
jgi:hypothetical protein